ncbi:MAG TPA: DUF4194 domain-containing protein, partial [Verrucomicrobiales bacterium]|nr:DUF4194 domain-containing protein [Verrucomicrobiales bacterium]
LLQAVPVDAGLLMRLRLDATLVLLTLWYELDTAIHERGEAPPVTISVESLTDSLRTKFEPLRKTIPAPTRLREILTLAQKKNLIRWEPADPIEQSRITIWPTLRRIIPFQDLEDWTRHAQSFTVDPSAPVEAPDDSDHSAS